MKISNPQNLTPKGIKNIIFDWGGVLINIDYKATINSFKSYGIGNFHEHYSQAKQRHLFDNLEIGAISPEEFREGIRAEFGVHISDQYIDDAWGAMLKDIPLERIDLLQKLGKKYRIFLLSNTNKIHEMQIIDKLNDELGFEFFSLFEKAYLSHWIGMRKPNADIFEYVLSDNNLVASESLFIDDSEQHVDGASALGINSFYLQPGMETADVFGNWI